jgi:2,4-dienoyl-CoA reductase-like NADH-dependent reductase (Old Yellow Enzyme family)
MPSLFDRFDLKGSRLKNRIAVAPMCQYSAVEGRIDDWHLVHLGSYAIGGAGLIFTEATAVSPEGRITPGCAGIWSDALGAQWNRVVHFLKRHGAVPGIQLSHAGRKASAHLPWEGDDHMKPDDPRAWQPLAPSAVAFGDKLPRVPHAMTRDEMARVTRDFASAARRAHAAGFEWLELHFAHGYLAQSFFSPIANRRTDEYGGSFDNRARFLLETFAAVREVWPDHLPLAVKLGMSDFTDESHTIEESIELARRMKTLGLDLVDVSLSFNTPDVSRVPWGPAFMAPFAERFKKELGMPVGVGWSISEPSQADAILRAGQADIVLLARAMLEDPQWAYRAAKALRVPNARWTTLPAPYAHWVGA